MAEQRRDAPAAPVAKLKTAGHVINAATELEKGAALPLKDAVVSRTSSRAA